MRRWLIKEEAKFPSLYRNECLIGRGGRKETGNSDSNNDNGLSCVCWCYFLQIIIMLIRGGIYLVLSASTLAGVWCSLLWSRGLNFEEVGKLLISPPTVDFTNWVSELKMTLNGAWAFHVFSHWPS